MRFGSLYLSTALAAASLLVAGCGDSGTDPNPTPVATTVTITSGAINLSEIGATATVTATVQDQNGQNISNPNLTFSSNRPSVVAVGTSSGVVTATGDGSATITVTSGSASSQTSVDVTVSVLQLNEPVGNLSGSGGSQRFFTVDVPAGALAGKALQFSTLGGSGNADIAVRFGTRPTPSQFDCAGAQDGTFFLPGNEEFCAFSNGSAGTWHVLLFGGSAYTGATLEVSLVDLTPLTPGVPVVGLSAAESDFLYFTVEVPGESTVEGQRANEVIAGSPFTDGLDLLRSDRSPRPKVSGPELDAGAPTLTAATFGGTGDVDLLGDVASSLSFTTVAPVPCVSFEDGNADACVVTDPTPGTWTFGLYSYISFSEVGFQVDYSPGTGDGGPTNGTITIQKEVQSSSGGTADNPANPDLSGFAFEIRPAGGGAVVATGTTDASGVAQVSLSPGSYDVTESDARGLTDVTTSAAGVTVPEGGTVDVAWINRQAAPSGGNGVPAAVIQGSPTAVPSGDNNQTEVRLYGGNSTDPDGDELTYAWSAPGGTFIGSTNLAFARVTFPGGTLQTISLTVSDGEAQNTAQFQIAGTSQLPAAGTFNIELVNADGSNPSAAVQNAFDLAAATLEGIVRGDAGDFNLNTISPDLRDFLEGTGEDQCNIGTTASGIIDDLRIYIDIAPIDGPGNTLGQAGPCLGRTGGPNAGQVLLGRMRFDSDDLENVSATALNRLILHEMLHVLGIGTLWGSLVENPSCPGGSCESGDPSPDTRYGGTEGVGAYRAIGGGAVENVPVENGEGTTAGSGTRDGHWREIVFDTELMTGYLDGGVVNPLSIITIQSLIDLGYTVSAADADNYALPAGAPARAADRASKIDLRGDLYLGQIWGVTETGELVLVRAGR